MLIWAMEIFCNKYWMYFKKRGGQFGLLLIIENCAYIQHISLFSGH